MNPIGTPFGPDQRPSAVEAARLVSEWRLSMEHSLQIRLHLGDTLRIEHGTVWVGTDAPGEPIALCEGATYTAAGDAVLHMTGIDDPRVTVCSGRPVMVSARADYGAWRRRPQLVDQ